MKLFLIKLKRYGVRRAFVYSCIFIFCKVRVLFYRCFFSDNKVCLRSTKILLPTQFIGKGSIEIINSQLGIWPSPGLVSGSGYIEARKDNSAVIIGDNTYINNGFVIIADKTKIMVGQRCLIGPNFFVTDSDFHGLELDSRTKSDYECSPVTIESDVFIGANVSVLKGVTIKRGAVIGSGSVVVKDVDEFCIYAGVPAKKIKSLSYRE